MFSNTMFLTNKFSVRNGWRRLLFYCVFLATTSSSLAGNTFELMMQQAGYSGQAQISEQKQQYSTVIPSANVYQRWGSPENPHQLFVGRGFLVLPVSYSDDIGVAAPELYYQYVPVPKRVKLGFGRIQYDWSILDSHWNLGLWQPLVRWDAASPIEQGLTGLFFEAGTSYFRSVFFASPVFLPDQQPSYSEEEGRIVSSNRWFRAPTGSALLQNSEADVYYEIIEPSASEVVFRGSFGMMAELGDRDGGPFIKGSYTDKPANQFHLAIDTERIFDISNLDFMTPIYPMVVRHRILTLEAGYRWADAEIVISTNRESYEKPDVPQNWQQTPLEDANYNGIVLSNNLSFMGMKRTKLSLSYVRRDLIENTEKSTLIKGEVEASTQRFQFNEITGVQFSTNLLRTFRQELDLRVNYVYSVIDAGEWLQLGAEYRYERQWTFALSGDVFGVEPDSLASTSFISKYRGNDRVIGSVSYVF